jgi:ABC-type polysaccharide/polyol phosphate transport system ATPase subunit
METYFSQARAVVIATHDENIINRLCNRVVVMKNGMIENMTERTLPAAA